MSRQQNANVPQQASRPPPVPPHPHEQFRAVQHGSTSMFSQPTPPPPPPKQQIEAHSERISNSSPISRYDAPPPLPNTNRPKQSQQPLNFHVGPQNSSPQSMPQRNTSLRQSMTPQQFQQQNFTPPVPSGSGNTVYSSAPPAGIPSQFTPPTILYSQARPPSQQNVFPQASLSQSIPHGQDSYQAPASQFPPHLSQTRNTTNQYQQNSVHPRPPPQPKPPPLNLLDSPFDINLPVPTADIPAPPIPPNPEKDALLSALSHSITQTLHNDMTQNASSLPLLRSQNEALNHSLRTLQSELAQLQALQSTLTGNVSILQNSLREADKCISSAHARAQRGEIPKIDEMLTAPTVVGKQLYDVVCDERGIEAAIWALQAALTRGRITMDVWAKKTRELSREGFKRKVLSGKIARGMGLEV